MPRDIAQRRNDLLQTDFGAAEFKQRRTELLDRLNGASALIKGGEHSGSSDPFRQVNEFYYFCGIVRPHAYLLIDGRSRSTTLYLSERSAHEERDEGATIGAQDAGIVAASSGVDAVKTLDSVTADLKGIKDLYILQRDGEGRMSYQDTLNCAQKDYDNDPLCNFQWPGQRLAQEVTRLYPNISLHDVYPFIEDMRMIKSPAEIDILREAGLITAQAVNEAMRSTRPGLYEYELKAISEYVYALNGAMGPGYSAIVSSGDNIWNTHYGQCNSIMNDGDLVLMDVACDLRYYTSDIGRFWPVNGKYSESQRRFYSWIVDYHKCLLGLIKPGLMSDDIESKAAEIMLKRVEKMTFEDEPTKAAFYKTFETKHLTHGVGMIVHDSGKYRNKPLEPGVVIAVDPQFWIPEKEFYIRVEDTVVVTEDGIENFTGASPLDPGEVEQITGSGGIIQSLRPNRLN